MTGTPRVTDPAGEVRQLPEVACGPAGGDHLTALVALRDPGVGKTRLSPLLSAAERAQVAQAMTRDVVRALLDAGITDVLVVAGGRAARSFARSIGLPVIADRRPHPDLNAALGDALRSLGPARTALLACADLPGLQSGDIAGLLAAQADVVVAPTHDGGTGGLLLRAGARIDLAYGASSAAVHRRRARRAGLHPAEVVSPGFLHDVDDPRDLHECVARWPTSHTGRLVTGWVATRTAGPPADPSPDTRWCGRTHGVGHEEPLPCP